MACHVTRPPWSYAHRAPTDGVSDRWRLDHAAERALGDQSEAAHRPWPWPRSQASAPRSGALGPQATAAERCRRRSTGSRTRMTDGSAFGGWLDRCPSHEPARGRPIGGIRRTAIGPMNLRGGWGACGSLVGSHAAEAAAIAEPMRTRVSSRGDSPDDMPVRRAVVGSSVIRMLASEPAVRGGRRSRTVPGVDQGSASGLTPGSAARGRRRCRSGRIPAPLRRHEAVAVGVFLEPFERLAGVLR